MHGAGAKHEQLGSGGDQRASLSSEPLARLLLGASAPHLAIKSGPADR